MYATPLGARLPAIAVRQAIEAAQALRIAGKRAPPGLRSTHKYRFQSKKLARPVLS
jgi:hypothetical protein